MSNQNINKVMAAINGTTLFNESTYFYELSIKSDKVEIETNEESKPFGAAILELPRPVFIAGPDAASEEDIIISALVLGNQHPDAVVRDLMRIRQFTEQSLKEYSMLTIGDIVLLSADKVYVAVNGALTVRTREEGFVTKRGVR